MKIAGEPTTHCIFWPVGLVSLTYLAVVAGEAALAVACVVCARPLAYAAQSAIVTGEIAAGILD